MCLLFQRFGENEDNFFQLHMKQNHAITINGYPDAILGYNSYVFNKRYFKKISTPERIKVKF